jgi:hypothetical protein
MNIDLILCHFGDFRFTVEPALSSFRRCFPEARTVLYTDDAARGYPEELDEIREVTPPYPRRHPRYGWRASDLYRGVGLLESKADVAVYSDSDMYFCSEAARALLPLTSRFGFCLPANPRLLVRTDALLGADTDKSLDETQGYGFAYNTAVASFSPASREARAFLEAYTRIMRDNPGRNPLNFYRAAVDSGFSPYVLPFQWCVCEDHIGIGDEIALHVGHRRVHDYYLGKAPRWLKETRRLAFALRLMYFPGKKNRAARRFWDFS